MDLVEIQFKIPHLHAGCVEQRQGHFSVTEIGGNLLLLASLQIHVQILLCTIQYVLRTMDYVLYTMDNGLCTMHYVLRTMHFVLCICITRSWYLVQHDGTLHRACHWEEQNLVQILVCIEPVTVISPVLGGTDLADGRYQEPLTSGSLNVPILQ